LGAVPLDPERDRLARLHARHHMAQVLGAGDVLAVRADDHVVGLEDAVSGGTDIDGADYNAVGRHLVPELAECNCGRDPLRRAHLGEPLLALDALGEVLRVVDVCWDESGPLVDPREVLLEETRLAHDDVDHVDAARPRAVVLALDVDERLDRPRRVRQEDVVVRGVEGEDRHRDREHCDDRGEREKPAFQLDPASTPTTSRTASADLSSSARSSSESSSSTIFSMPPAPIFTGTPM